MNADLFCLDCESIGTNAKQCEPCGSRALYPVRAWLERKPAAETLRESGIARYWREQAAEHADDYSREAAFRAWEQLYSGDLKRPVPERLERV